MVEKKINLIIIDDHPLFREGVARLIEQKNNFILVAQAGDAQEAFTEFEQNQIDFALIDISLKGMDGIELIKNLRGKYPDLLILVISMHDELYYASRALKAGAQGYIMKQEASKKVLTAIERILSGRIYLSDEMQDRMLKMAVSGETDSMESDIRILSDREFQVFQMIGEGLGITTIANNLNISIKTVETYRHKMKNKLKLRNALELRQLAIKWVQNNKK